MTSKGVVLIAKNNGETDYVKQAVYLSIRIKKYLDLPTSIITDSAEYLREKYGEDYFDQVIEIGYDHEQNRRRYHDGTLSQKVANFRNSSRFLVYDLSPYQETLVLDTDYIICNSKLKECFESVNDLMLFKKSEDISKVRDEREFVYLSDYSIDFYWATVTFFRKNNNNEIFFNLIAHIEENWEHYRKVYHIPSTMFRNDFAFSIANHMMNGFTKGDFVKELPVKHFYTIDKDILWKLDGDEMMFLVEKKDHIGEYTPILTKGQNVHVMNKFSLERQISKEMDFD